MRLLYLTPRVPHPRMKGDALVVFRRIEHLAGEHDISLVASYASDDELGYVDWLREACVDVRLVPLRRATAIANVALGIATTRLPLQILYYRSRAFRNEVAQLLAERTFDIVHVFMLRMAPYGQLAPAPCVLDAMDSMHLRMERNIAVDRPPKRWLYGLEMRRAAEYEPVAAAAAGAVIVVSPEDGRYFPTGSVHVVPNGVDTVEFAPAELRATSSEMIFSGTMSYGPNVSAVGWFADECLPTIRTAVPTASLTIAGTNPTHEVRALARRPGITVTGFVESMPAQLRRAAVAIAPMQSGAGIQNKVLEAMACGLPVVSTSIGASGIDAVRGRDLVVADGRDAFAREVLRLLQHPEEADLIGKNARAAVVERHRWEHAAAAITRVYFELQPDATGAIPETRD